MTRNTVGVWDAKYYEVETTFAFFTRLSSNDVIETNVKIFLEKLNCFRRYSILKFTYVSKNSNKMAGNS